MHLIDAILETNQRYVAGSRPATLPAAELGGSLPLAVLSCIDARLNHLLPDALGVPEEQFIWLRNAGNIITGPLSSTMRSLALACAVKGAKEIAIIGHTDCLVGKTTMLELLERLGAQGVSRHLLPENLTEYFGLFASERQNVLRGVEFARASPLIGNKVPIHGFLVDLQTGRVECVANGYDAPRAAVPGKPGELLARAEQSLDALARIGRIATEDLQLPDTKIGEVVSIAQDWLHKAEHVAAAIAPAQTAAGPSAPPPVPPIASPVAKPPPNPLLTLQQRMRQFTASQQPPRKPGKR
jgi:carbonic anhydrase